jgi:hypothetical protein
MSFRFLALRALCVNKVGKIDPACRPPRSQPIPYKPGKVVVQMVVYLPSPLTQKPVLASFLKGGSEDTLSVFTGSEGIRRHPKTLAGQAICASDSGFNTRACGGCP